MSKVTLPEVEEIVGLDCTHFIYASGLEEGDEVACPVCADIEKRVKAVLEKVKMLTMLLEDMTKLHAEDCKETECCNILAVRKYFDKIKAENDSLDA